MQRPQLVDAQRDVLIDGSDPTTSDTLTVTPGEAADDARPGLELLRPRSDAARDIRFVLRDGRKLEAVPASPTDATVPPCNGAGRRAISRCTHGHIDARDGRRDRGCATLLAVVHVRRRHAAARRSAPPRRARRRSATRRAMTPTPAAVATPTRACRRPQRQRLEITSQPPASRSSSARNSSSRCPGPPPAPHCWGGSGAARSVASSSSARTSARDPGSGAHRAAPRGGGRRRAASTAHRRGSGRRLRQAHPVGAADALASPDRCHREHIDRTESGGHHGFGPARSRDQCRPRPGRGRSLVDIVDHVSRRAGRSPSARPERRPSPMRSRRASRRPGSCPA